MSSAAIRGGRVAIEIGADVKRFYAALNAIQSRMASFGTSVTGVGTQLAGLGVAATAPFAVAARTSAGFQDTMSAVAAISNATGDEFASLQKRAMELGASTSFTAQQVADGMQVLSQAGFTTDETLASIEGTLNLARTGMMDLGEATDFMVSTLRAFQVPASDAARVSDVLAKTAMASNAEVSNLGESMTYVASIASSLGVSIEEVSAMLGVMADRGIKGSVAGTGLRRIFMGLASEGAKLKELGVEVKDPQTGKLKPMVQILKDLRASIGGMDATEQLSKLSKIFDVFGANAIFAMINAGDAVGNLVGELGNARGSAAAVAAQMDDNLGGSMRMAMSAAEGLSLAVGQALTPTIRAFLKQVQEVAGGLMSWVQRNQEATVAIFRTILATIGLGGALIGTGLAIRLVAVAFGGFATAIKVALSPIALLVGTSKLLIASFSATQAALGGMVGRLLRATAAAITFTSSITAMAIRVAAQFAYMAAAAMGHAIAMTASLVGAAITIAGAWLAHMKALVTYYTGRLAFMTAITISRTAAMAGAWIAQAGAAVGTFAIVAAASLSQYVATLATATAATIGSVASMAAAWLAPLAPIAILVAAVLGINRAIQQAFSNSGDIATSLSQLFAPLSEGFQQIGADAYAAFADIYATATATFGSIYDAITAGDLSLAFEALWAGLAASWLRGQQLVMGYVDFFIEGIQTAWADLSSSLSIAIVQAMGIVERAWIGMTGTLTVAWQTAINGVMNMWDIAVGAIQKAIAYIRSFFDKSIDYDKVRKQIDDANAQRRGQRDEAVRQGMSDEQRQRLDESQSREAQAIDFIREQNSSDAAARGQRTQGRADSRQAVVDAANATVANVRQRAAAAREATELTAQAQEANAPQDLQALYARAEQLFKTGLINDEAFARLNEALDDRAVQLDKERALAAQQQATQDDAKNIGEAAKDGLQQEVAKVENVGTFSALQVAQFGASSTLAERTARAAEETAKNTRDMRPKATA